MKWKNNRAIRLIWLSLALMLAGTLSASAFNFPDSPSYNYFTDGTRISAPEAFAMEEELTLSDLGVEGAGSIADAASYDGRLFLLDQQGNRVIVVDEQGNLSAVLGADAGLSQPEGFFVSRSGMLYIADTGNARIVKMDSQGTVQAIVPAPDPTKTMSEVEYAPIRVVVDAAERLYVLARNETNGIYQLNMQGEFLGFFGSVPVNPSITERLWRMVSTKEQRARMLLFVPTEYSSMDIDEAGFIYTTVATNTDSDMLSFIESGDTQLAPIRRLNSKGKDVLLRTESLPPAGDVEFPVTASREGNASRFIDIAVRDDGLYSALDSTRSRVFTYSSDGDLLYVFGENNETASGLQNPVALCYWGEKIAVVDQGNACVKIFAPTAYAMALNQAVIEEKEGNYEQASLHWDAVLEQHSTSSLAYMAKGRECMRSKDYTEAMSWFRLADSQEYYSKAFRLYRQEGLGNIIGWVILGLAVLCVGVVLLQKWRKKRPAKAAAAPSPLSQTMAGVRYGTYIMRHPFDGFWDMSFEKRGSLKAATIILALVTLINLVSMAGTGYIVAGSHLGENLLVQGCLGILVPVALWCVASWSMTTLMNGSGSMANIYMYTCYSLTPLLFGQPVLILLSHIITTDEAAIYTILQMLLYIWVAFLLFSGTLTVHQYTPKKTLAAILVTIVAIAVILFLLLLGMTILQQMTGFVQNLYEEIRMRT